MADRFVTILGSVLLTMGVFLFAAPSGANAAQPAEDATVLEEGALVQPLQYYYYPRRYYHYYPRRYYYRRYYYRPYYRRYYRRYY